MREIQNTGVIFFFSKTEKSDIYDLPYEKSAKSTLFVSFRKTFFLAKLI